MAFLHQPDGKPSPSSQGSWPWLYNSFFYAAFSGEGLQHAGKPTALGINIFLLPTSTLL